MLAWASVEGAGFPDYDGYEVGRWPEAPPNFGGREFEAIFCANFIEHIIRPLDFVRLAASRLAPGGRLYLEWPTETSIKLPTRFQFQDAGLPVMIGAYHDDPSHRQKPPLLADVRAAIVEAGLTETSWGVASVPFIDQQLAIRSREAGDMVGMTLAYWSHTGWTQYLVAEKY
jgi:SAM-dependent methyltransferase